MAVHARLFSIMLLLLHHVSYGLDASSAVDNLPPISPSIPASYYASQTSSSSSLLLSPSPMPEAPTINISLLSSTATDCSCDFIINSCDPNCCCDSDCTADEITVFAQCSDILQDSSTSSFCINGYDIFRSSLTNSRLSNLFCVYTDNYPGRREFSSINTVSTLPEAEDSIVEFGNTGSLLSANPSFEPYESEYYRSGDPIEIVYNNDASGYLPLPSALNGDFCHDGNPITYLNDKTSTCTRYLSSNGQECAVMSSLNAEVFYRNFSVLAFPASAENDNTTLIPVELESLTCRDLIGQEVSCDSVDPPLFDSPSLVCNNALLSLSYIIVHNATQGIISVSMNIVVGVVPIGYIAQSFSVEFVYFDTNETESIDFVRPGNPGYIQGQPILGGNIVDDTVNVSSSSNLWFTVPFGDNNGLCQKHRDSIVFRNDHRSSCIFKVSLDDIILGGCENLDTISILLGRQPYTNRLGIYGNADVNDLSQWIEILGLDDESVPIRSQCSNVVTGVQIIVFYSYTGDISSPQAVITGSQVKYLTQDIKPQCLVSLCSSNSPNIPIILESIVTFIPVYTPPDEVLLSATLTTRRLPQDFLYPLFTGSDSSVVVGSMLLTVMSVFISLQVLSQY